MNIKTAVLGLMLGASSLVGCKNYKEFKIEDKVFKIPKDSIEKYNPVFQQKVKYISLDYEVITNNDCYAYEDLYCHKIFPSLANEYLKNDYVKNNPNHGAYAGIDNLVRLKITPEEFSMYDCSVQKAGEYRIENIGALATTFFPKNTSIDIIFGVFNNDLRKILYYEEKKKDGKISEFKDELFVKAKSRVTDFYKYFNSLKELVSPINVSDEDAVLYFDKQVSLNLVKDNITHGYFDAYDASKLFKNGITNLSLAKKYQKMDASEIKLFLKNNISPNTVRYIDNNLTKYDREMYSWKELVDNNLVNYAYTIAKLNSFYDGELSIKDVVEFSKKGITISEIEHTLRGSYVKRVVNREKPEN